MCGNKYLNFSVVLVVIFSLVWFIGGIANAYEKPYVFHYNTDDQLKVTIPRAESYEEAFSKASKLCFQILTKGVYQGEEPSLKIIDICANPNKR